MSSSASKDDKDASKSRSRSAQQTVTTATIQTSGFEVPRPDYPDDFVPTFVSPDFVSSPIELHSGMTAHLTSVVSQDKNACVKGEVDKGGGYL